LYKCMNHTTHTTKKIARLVTTLAIAVFEAKAEDERRATKRIVISIPDKKLVLFEGGEPIKVYDVAVGKPSTPTPQGEFQIVQRLSHPTWFGPNKVVAPGKNNPLGTRWLGLSVAGYGIHGTNVPSSIGKAASHGCIRMRNQDVEELFELVGVGVKVALSTQIREESYVSSEEFIAGSGGGVTVGSGGALNP
jgi:lipoprotein-anchoring transpeptidase ErfK/SrfK